MDLHDIFQVPETCLTTQILELANCLVVCGPGVLVPNRDSGQFKETLGRFGSENGISAGTRNGSALKKGQCTL
jgi:hypothetical protein